MTPDEQARRTRAGVGFALAAYVAWGVSPIFWQWLAAGPWEIVAHRGVWGLLALLPFVWARNPGFAGLFSARRLFWAGVGALLIGSNWLAFIWAVTSGRVLESSLGYFIGPLVNVLLGVVFLRERLRPRQTAAVALAAAGVAIPLAAEGHAPFIALFLAVSFSLYALVRKKLDVDGASGLFLECLLFAPFGLAAAIWFEATGRGHFLEWSWQPVLLIASGMVFTSGVLLLFLLAARRLKLSTVGLIQFVSPTLQFCIALLLGEAFPPARAAAFVLIWAGLFLYAADMLRHERTPAPMPRSPVG